MNHLTKMGLYIKKVNVLNVIIEMFILINNIFKKYKFNLKKRFLINYCL